MVAVEPSNPKVDTDKIEKAIREILIAIGENPEREGLIDTPRRVAKFYQEFIQKSEPHCTIFAMWNIMMRWWSSKTSIFILCANII